MFSGLSIIEDGKAVKLLVKDDQVLRFHAIWLRDNAQDEATRAAGNGQKLITLNDISEDIMIKDAQMVDGGISLIFSDRDVAVFYADDWLLENAYDGKPTQQNICINPSLITWDAQDADRLPIADYGEVLANSKTKYNWLLGMHRYGFAHLTGGAIEDGALLDVAGLFGYVRETNYGRLFNVRTEVNPVNLAFTGAGLQGHTDNPYRDPVPTMQILYCLENSAEGGDSIVVDGYRCIERMLDENSRHVELLSRYSARFSYVSGGASLISKRPMIELSPEGEVLCLRFNNRSAAAMTDIPYTEMEAYYEAYRHLARLVDDAAMQVQFKLEPGACFIVDNTRVLHARRGYTGEGHRWLQGCYPDKDGLLSTLGALEAEGVSA